MANNTEYATSGSVLNYSGAIFLTGDNATPLLNALPRKKTNSSKFPVTQSYATGAASQPSISENASLTAPVAKPATRKQEYNVTQIFQKSVAVSYKKQSNFALMSGINVAGDVNPIQNEIDFQTGVKAQEMRNDLEYTIINGVYAEDIDDDTAAKTRGLLAAVPSENTVTVSTTELDIETVTDAMEKLRASHAPTDGLVLICSATQKRQLSKSATLQNGFLLPNSRTVGGRNIDQIVTDFGTVGVIIHDKMPNGTALIANLSVVSIVEQDVPGKGNFFLEELAKTGAGYKAQLFGQAGLDYGPAWYHAKITGLKTTYDKPAAKVLAK